MKDAQGYKKVASPSTRRKVQGARCKKTYIDFSCRHSQEDKGRMEDERVPNEAMVIETSWKKDF